MRTIVGWVPAGRVTTYGHVALLAGRPRAARAVGTALSRLPEDTDVPWHRVVGASGFLTIRGRFFAKDEQQARLTLEGVEFIKPYKLDIRRYGWFVTDGLPLLFR